MEMRGKFFPTRHIERFTSLSGRDAMNFELSLAKK